MCKLMIISERPRDVERPCNGVYVMGATWDQGIEVPRVRRRSGGALP